MNWSPKLRQFVSEYIVDFNGTQAAIRAGYSPRTAYSIASENLTKPEVQLAIQETIEKRMERTEVTQDYVVDRLYKIVERCMQGTPVLDKEGKPVGRWTFQANSANRALELLGKHQGMFIDRSETLNLTLAGNMSAKEAQAAIKALPKDELKALAVVVFGDQAIRLALREALETVTEEELDAIIKHQKALAAGEPTIEARVVG